MKKEYRDAILVSIASQAGRSIIEFLKEGRINWALTILGLILTPFVYLYSLKIYKRREARARPLSFKR